MQTIFILSIVGFILYSALKSSFTNLTTPLSITPRIIPEEIELNSVRDALMEKQGWFLERAEAARTEYIRFLTLLQKKPGFMLIPWLNKEGQDDLDQFWHQHILDTAKYAADCEALFGRMIHHNPHLVRGSEAEGDAKAKTQRLYARTFSSGSYGRPVDSADLTGCGACGSSDSGGSSDGHSGDSGHGCGGHGCGGHGCGGHGCGSGCGGH
jgi:hypothetical protein